MGAANRKFITLAGLLLGGLGVVAAETELPRSVQAALARAQVPPESAAFVVTDLSSGRPRLSHRALAAAQMKRLLAQVWQLG